MPRINNATSSIGCKGLNEACRAQQSLSVFKVFNELLLYAQLRCLLRFAFILIPSFLPLVFIEVIPTPL